MSATQTATRRVDVLRRRDGGGTFTGRECGVAMHLDGSGLPGPVVVGWGSPAEYPRSFVIVSEPYPHPRGGDFVLVAEQSAHMEWMLNPDGSPHPPGSFPAPTNKVVVQDGPAPDTD